MSIRSCVVEGCGSRHKARGYCDRHYSQLRAGHVPGTIKERNRQPVQIGRPPRPPIAEEIEALGGVEYLGVKGVMDALGMTAGAIAAALRREGRPDLTRPFEREEHLERRGRRAVAA